MIKIIESFINFFKNRHHRHYRDKKFHLAADLSFAMIILILAVFVIAIKFGVFQYKNKMSFEITPEISEITSGRETIFEIKYANSSKINLLKTKFSLNLPEDFILKEVLSNSYSEDFFDKKTSVFSVGDLIPGANGKIKIKILVVGDSGSREKIILNSGYFMDNEFFNEFFSQDFIIEKSSLELKWDHAGILYEKQPSGMLLNLKNSGDVDLDKVELNFTNSDIALDYENCDSNIEAKDNRLKIKQLKAGDSLKINFNLIYSGKSQTAAVKLEIFASANNGRIKQADLAENFIIKQPCLSVEINSTRPSAYIGDKIDYEIILKNSCDENIGGLTLDLSSGDSKRELLSVEMKNVPFAELSCRQIIFDKVLSKDHNQKIELAAEFSRQKIFLNDEIILKSTARYNSGEAKLKAFYFSNPVKIKTTYQFKAETRYFSAYGDQLGVGPIPPIAGIPTKYWIFWHFKNQGNKLSDFKVSADLAENAIWSGENSLNKGRIDFDKEKKIFIWSVDSIGGMEENYGLALALTIIPPANYGGENMIILKNIRYSFIDNFTGERISGSAGDLDDGIK